MRKIFTTLAAVSALALCLTLVAFLGATQASAAVLVNVPMNQQINVGLGDAIYGAAGQDAVSIQPAAPPVDPTGFARCTITVGAKGWYMGPRVDFVKAGIGTIDISNPDTKLDVDVRYFQAPNNTKPYYDAPIFLRIYSYDATNSPVAFRDYSAIVQFSGETWRYPYWKHISLYLNSPYSEGEVVAGSGIKFDPTKVGMFRFYGTAWTAVSGSDWVDAKNFKIANDAPFYSCAGFENLNLGSLIGQNGWLDDSSANNPWGPVQVVTDPTGANRGNTIKFKVWPTPFGYGIQGAYVPIEGGTNKYMDLSWDQYREKSGTNKICNDNVWFTEDKVDYTGDWGIQWDSDAKFHPISNWGNPAAPLSANAWEHINLRYDFNAHTVTIMKNGTNYGTGPIPASTSLHMWDYEIESIGTTDDEDGPAYVDNIRADVYPQPVLITGKVTDGAGNPVSGAFVGVKATTNAAADANVWCTTDANGNYATPIVPAGQFYLAAWKPGFKPSADQQVTVSTTSVTCNLSLAPAGANYALSVYGSTASTNNPDSNNDPNFVAGNAIDGSMNTRFGSNNTDPGQVNKVPTWLMVDLGQNRTINEADIVWENARATVYKLQVLPDGADPSNEANWTDATTVYSTASGSGATVSGGHLGSAIKLPATTGRYWRIYATSAVYYLISVYEFQLRGSAQVGPASGKVGDVKNLPAGSAIALSGLRVTALPGAGVPAGMAYVEASDRSGAVCVDTSAANMAGIGIGDEISIEGPVTTLATGEKAVKAAVSRTNSMVPLDAVVMNSRAASDKVSAGMFVKLVGKVSNPTADSFTITDGGKSVVVKCGSLTQPTEGSMVRVKGVISTDGTNPVLYMRNAQVDWTNADATYQWLPFAGSHQAVKSFLVIGPFSNGTMDRATALSYDFINAADPNQSENSVRPVAGDTIGDLTWRKVDAPNDFLDFNAAFGGSEFKNYTAYAFVYATLPTASNIYFGSDDSIEVFLNGIYATGGDYSRGTAYGQNTAGTMDTNNAVLIKIVNTGGGWGTVMHLDKDGSGSQPDLNQCGYSLDKQGVPN